MTQANSASKLAGNVAMLVAIIGLLTFFSGVFSFAPRTFVFVGVALIVLSLAAFYAEELGQRRLTK